MKVLTVRQPWASLIIMGLKPVENRTRNIAGSFRGRFAIHVSKTLVPDGDPAWSLATAAGMDTDRFDGDELHLGAIIGIVDLVDVHTSDDCYAADLRRLHAIHESDPAAFHALPDSGGGGIVGRIRQCSPWAMDGHHHLILANPQPLPEPIPAKGRLGLWEFDVEASA